MKIKVGKNKISVNDSIILGSTTKEEALKKAFENDPFNLKNDPAVVKAFGDAYDAAHEAKVKKTDQK